MTKTQIKTTIQVLKSTPEYKCGQIDIKVDDNHVLVCSIDGSNECFHQTALIQLFAYLSSYVQYNRLTNQCELVIF